MIIQGKGQLRHRFWGEYSALIVLTFKDADSCGSALKTLGAPWKLHEKEPRAMYCICSTEELEGVTAQLVRYGAEEKKIASLEKSIDFGEPFEVTIPAEDPRQEALFRV